MNKQRIKVRMLKEMTKWTSKEIKLLIKLKNEKKIKKWENISQVLGQIGWERSLDECRNQWKSCLSSSMKNQAWTDDELRLLYTLYNKYDAKWSLIQKQMPNRTQSRIKNHFYSVLRGITRHTLKYFYKKNETKITNMISPTDLKLIFKGSGNFSFLEDLIPKCIEAMNFRLQSVIFNKYVSQNLTKFQKLYQEIINLTSQSPHPQQQQISELNQDIISLDKQQKSEGLQKLIIEQTIPTTSNSQYIVPQNYLISSYNYPDNSWMYPQICQVPSVPMYEFSQFGQYPMNPDYCFFSCLY